MPKEIEKKKHDGKFPTFYEENYKQLLPLILFLIAKRTTLFLIAFKILFFKTASS